MQNITESQWIEVARSLGIEFPTPSILYILKTHYSTEFAAFEK